MNPSRTRLVFAGALALLALVSWSLLGRPPQAVSPPAGAPVGHDAHTATAEPRLLGLGTAPVVPQGASVRDAARPPLVCAPPEGHAARVGDEALSVASLCARLGGMGGLGPAGADRGQGRIALDQLIDAILVRQALAQERAAVTETELDEALGALQPQGPDAGVDPLLRAQMRERLELQRLLATRPNTAVTEGDVDLEIARGAPDIDRGQGVRVEGWVARRGPRPAGGDRPEAQEAAESFARAVQSQSPEEAAGRLGLSHLAPFVLGAHGTEPDLEQAASGLAPGQWSGAVSTRVGWVVLRVIAREEGQTLSPDVLRARVRQALERQRLQTARQDLLVSLRANARIEILVDL